MMAELLDHVPARALAIYAHPDDPDVSCGGTLAVWAKSGCEVTVLLCTDGGKGSPDPTLVPRDLIERRVAEAAEAAAVIGVAVQEHLNYPDGELADDPEFRRALVEAVRRFRPDVVLCPDPTAIFFGQEYFNHRDHRVVGLAALDAVAPAAALPHYFPEAGPAHQVSTVLLSGTLEPDVFAEGFRRLRLGG
jgi:LmbE family N-acetylglucosaminyl deacetylase